MINNLFEQADYTANEQIKKKTKEMAERYYEITYQNYMGLLDSLQSHSISQSIQSQSIQSQSISQSIQSQSIQSQSIQSNSQSEIKSEIELMRQDVLPRETTLQFLIQFLLEHQEFVQNPDYLEHLGELFEYCQENIDEYKSALNTLVNEIETNENETNENENETIENETIENETIENENETNENETIENNQICYAEATLEGTLVSWNTNNDPILALLYPIFLTMFGVKYFDKIPEITANLK